MKTFTILTTSPNDLLKKIHDRMPVVLEKEEEDQWLDPGMDTKYLLTEILDPFPAGNMLEHEVSREVNSPRNDRKEITKPKKESTN